MGGFFSSDSPLFITWKSEARYLISTSPEKSGDSKIIQVWRFLVRGWNHEPDTFLTPAPLSES